MRALFTFSVLFLVCDCQYTTVERKSRSSSDFTCSNSLGCIFECRGDDACKNTRIYCPANGEYCKVRCRGDSSCYQATIYSQSTQSVYVHFDVDDYIGYNADIYAPDDGGDLEVFVEESWEGFRYGNIYDMPGTNKIKVTCNKRDPYWSESWWGDYDDCQYMSIDARDSQFLEVIVEHDSHLKSSSIYCPVNSDYGSTSCLIDCTDTDSCRYNSFYARNGIPEDVKVSCSSSEDGSCYASYVHCGSGYASRCEYTQNPSDTWYCDDVSGTCNIPTAFPTTSPTLRPTTSPTIEPSDNPTESPSERPTKMPIIPGDPTQYPSARPTNLPSTLPTKAPSNLPTVTITSEPSGQPSESPTFAAIVVVAPTAEPIGPVGSSVESVHDTITFDMTVESNTLQSADLFEADIKASFVGSVRDAFDLGATYYSDDTVDTSALSFGLRIEGSTSNAEERRLRRRQLLQTNDTDDTADGVIFDFDYDITVEWSMSLPDETSLVVMSEVLTLYAVNVTDEIERDYFGLNRAIVTILNVNGELGVTPGGDDGDTETQTEKEKDETILLGLGLTEVIVIAVVGGILIIAACISCAVFCALRKRKQGESGALSPSGAEIALAEHPESTPMGFNATPGAVTMESREGSSNAHEIRMNHVPSMTAEGSVSTGLQQSEHVTDVGAAMSILVSDKNDENSSQRDGSLLTGSNANQSLVTGSAGIGAGVGAGVGGGTAGMASGEFGTRATRADDDREDSSLEDMYVRASQMHRNDAAPIGANGKIAFTASGNAVALGGAAAGAADPADGAGDGVVATGGNQVAPAHHPQNPLHRIGARGGADDSDSDDDANELLQGITRDGRGDSLAPEKGKNQELQAGENENGMTPFGQTPE